MQILHVNIILFRFIQDLNALTSSNLKLTEDQKQYFKNI